MGFALESKLSSRPGGAAVGGHFRQLREAPLGSFRSLPERVTCWAGFCKIFTALD